jgi:hypothetical protein
LRRLMVSMGGCTVVWDQVRRILRVREWCCSASARSAIHYLSPELRVSHSVCIFLRGWLGRGGGNATCSMCVSRVVGWARMYTRKGVQCAEWQVRQDATEAPPCGGRAHNRKAGRHARRRRDYLYGPIHPFSSPPCLRHCRASSGCGRVGGVGIDVLHAPHAHLTHQDVLYIST